MKNGISGTIIFLLLFIAGEVQMPLNGNAEENNPIKILQKSKDMYGSLKTYMTQGVAVIDFSPGKSITHFKILFKKPNLYLISWEQNNSKETDWLAHSTGAVWNDGTGPYLYTENSQKGKSYAKKKSDEIALSSAVGVSSGEAYIMPTAFFPMFKMGKSIFDKLINPRLDRVEKVENDDCYVISGSTQESKNVMVWISETNYLIKRFSRSFAHPIGYKSPEMSDKAVGNILLAEGLKNTPEERLKLRERFKKNDSDIENKGEEVENYVDISTPELTSDKFKFRIPEGAKQTHNSFLGEI